MSKPTNDRALFVFTPGNKLVMFKDKKSGNPKLFSTKYFKDPVASWSARFGAPLKVADEMDILQVHNVSVVFARTNTEDVTHEDLLVFESLDAMKEEVGYESFGYPLRSAGWQGAVYNFTETAGVNKSA